MNKTLINLIKKGIIKTRQRHQFEDLKDDIKSVFQEAFIVIAHLKNVDESFKYNLENDIWHKLLNENSSFRQDRKRTLIKNSLANVLQLKNSYLYLASIMDEASSIINKYAKEKLIESSGNFYIKLKYNKKNLIRHKDLSVVVHLISNMIKHTQSEFIDFKNGRDELSKILLKAIKAVNPNDFKRLQNMKVFDLLDSYPGMKVSNTFLSNTIDVTLSLYVFFIDLAAFELKLNNFRIRNYSKSKYEIYKQIMNDYEWKDVTTYFDL